MAPHDRRGHRRLPSPLVNHAAPAVFAKVHTLIEWTIFPIAAFILTNALGELLGGLG